MVLNFHELPIRALLSPFKVGFFSVQLFRGIAEDAVIKTSPGCMTPRTPLLFSPTSHWQCRDCKWHYTSKMTFEATTTTPTDNDRVNGDSKQYGNVAEDRELADTLRPIYAQFISDLNLPPLERFESEKLLAAILETAAATGVPHPAHSHSYENLLVGYSYADVSYICQRHPDSISPGKEFQITLNREPELFSLPSIRRESICCHLHLAGAAM